MFIVDNTVISKDSSRRSQLEYSIVITLNYLPLEKAVKLRQDSYVNNPVHILSLCPIWKVVSLGVTNSLL